jgi:hypothetical protein
MTREELEKIPRKEAKHLLAEKYPLMAVTVALNLEWWRGYHAVNQSDDLCQCPTCGRMHRHLGTPPKGMFRMHESTYDPIRPTDAQLKLMAKHREAAKAYGDALEQLLPDGPDKVYVIYKHRENAMWANVAIVRLPDGTPRE